MLRLSQLRGALRIRDMIEASKWMAANNAYPRRYLSDADREYLSWFPSQQTPAGVQEVPRG